MKDKCKQCNKIHTYTGFICREMPKYIMSNPNQSIKEILEKSITIKDLQDITIFFKIRNDIPTKIMIPNKDLIKAVLPVLRKIYDDGQLYSADKYLEFLKELVK